MVAETCEKVHAGRTDHVFKQGARGGLGSPSNVTPANLLKDLPLTGSTSSQCCYPGYQVCNSQMARDRGRANLNHSSSPRLSKMNTNK